MHPSFDEAHSLHELHHYLPAQASLKDFIHHNSLHAFQHLRFHEGVGSASKLFGYKVYLSLPEFRALYEKGQIRKDVMQQILVQKHPPLTITLDKLLHFPYETDITARIGLLRENWKKQTGAHLDALVHPILFRVLSSYFDQGIAIMGFPYADVPFLEAMRQLEKNSFSSVFRNGRAKQILLSGKYDLEALLKLIVGEEALFEQYLFDQQFAHQGWSGLVATVERQPETLLDRRNISLKDLIIFELLLEMDALDYSLGKSWKPLAEYVKETPPALFEPNEKTELDWVYEIWQEAYEWSYYDQVLAGIQAKPLQPEPTDSPSFQGIFCIDDRECSYRRYLEQLDKRCATFGTPGFFGIEFFFQPENGKFYTKVCPAPVTPKYLIKEVGNTKKQEIDLHFSKHTHSFAGGWLVSQTLGFWSAVKLFFNIFRPSMSPATAHSFKHLDKAAQLVIEHSPTCGHENGLQVGFTLDEMAIRVENVLRSIGLVEKFAPLVYVVGHGASSVNNPHYAAYDCGACSGRAGSVNARAFAYMANQAQVREILQSKGIRIPESTRFVGAIRDTTRDEIQFFDEDSFSAGQRLLHQQNLQTFEKALDLNAKERSRRFESIDTRKTAEEIHEKILTRSVSLFEPRPELNHATNALCIVGRRGLSQGLFLDRRSFLNSFDYRVDPEGVYLTNILNAAAPVCGGINLEYYFSRTDNQKLGAGTKLPHNVVGLVAVANGADGDLRPGLPSQMIEVHDPVRLLMIVEHFPEVVLRTIQKNPATYEWFINEWVNLVCVQPESRALFVFRKGEFVPYKPLTHQLEVIPELDQLLASSQENFPVYLLGEI